MKFNELLGWYEQLLSQSNTMIVQAKNGQWEALIESEMIYLQSVEVISSEQANNGYRSSSRKEIRSLLNKVLANEDELKNLLSSRMDEIRSQPYVAMQ
ncbi:flagellar protein FliT [Pantoea sp. GM01]|uniref:flagellar protein FliT n=1 Tax=Pantoea sp. GM01 TaxID=1144320 RepID=UPI00027143B8|nr:flagellar protein FliT [Pantoea sp. GM01]EJL84656.1 Flagellar protein FliT [Pantoea sp. GM01]